MLQIREKLTSSAGEEYGVNDNSYRAAGELQGLMALSKCFYDYMDSEPSAEAIRDMHKPDLSLSIKKLAYFLAGWLGGPKLYAEHFGSINIPKAHQHLVIDQSHSDSWILCMQKAIDEQPYESTFKTYLIEQLKIPAARIVAVAEKTPS